jgi:hypothetical protein
MHHVTIVVSSARVRWRGLAWLSRSVDLCDGHLPLAGLRRVALNGWSGGCSGHLFGFGVDGRIARPSLSSETTVTR